MTPLDSKSWLHAAGNHASAAEGGRGFVALARNAPGVAPARGTEASDASDGERPACVTITLTQFDERHYRSLIDARGKTIRHVIGQLKPLLQLETALDAGCGVGFFSELLRDCGLVVGGFDARAENIAEARRRFPEIAFEQANVEDEAVTRMGKFDLVLCFGLLYHLESPLRAIRHLRAITGKGLLLESMCVPGVESKMALREEPRAADQSLTEIAVYPSESCLVKMLYRAGFAMVYRVTKLPDHDDFRESPDQSRKRTVLFASFGALRLAGFEEIREPKGNGDPWSKDVAPTLTLSERVRRFAARTKRDKYIRAALRLREHFPWMPIPLRLPYGAWWLAEESRLDQVLIRGDAFEAAEMGFVAKVMRPGMTVLDVGAHHGLYTLLIAKRAGRHGRVIAFEPSPRERKRLLRHLRLNRCRNVTVEPYALGEKDGEAIFFVVEGSQDWCNSLRPPAVEEGSTKLPVEVRRVDATLAELGVSRVDLIKLDVEGAELSFLRGATRLLSGELRPAMLIEVQDFRTRSWGYQAREIVDFLEGRKYCWFGVTEDGGLQPISTQRNFYDENLVALPQERAREFLNLLME